MLAASLSDLSIHLITSLPSLTDATISASEGFGQTISRALILDVEQHLDVCHFGYRFEDKQGEIAGFTLFKIYDDLLCGGGMMIRPAFQRCGLVKHGIRLAQEQTQARYLAYRTQSPRMWSAGRKLARVWSPTLEHGFSHPELDPVRERAAELLQINPTVTRAVFDRPLYNEQPIHADSTLQAWWNSICDFTQGDMVLCVGAF